MSTFDPADPGDSSESEDEDYVPRADESDRDASDCGEDFESDVKGPAATTSKRRKRKASPRRERKGGICLDSDEEDPSHKSDTEDAAVGRDKAGSNGGNDRDDNARESEAVTYSAQERAKAESLWSDFLRDANGVPKKRAAVAADPCQASTSSASGRDEAGGSGEKKVTITQLMDFAGETFKVEKKVAADSKEARLFAKEQGNFGTQAQSSSALTGKRQLGGTEGILGHLLSKKTKMSTLEKSKLDWDRFKHEEGISEELKSHNRGKGGYLEKQAFLQRTDERQFEIEKGQRAKSRSANRP
uniref:Craniofacial development protein 1 n=1 Tax=Amblyomma maculatum TaxID=34609 RepID=G3MKW5_AMBMU